MISFMHGTKISSFTIFSKKKSMHIAQYVFSCEFPIENRSNIHGNALMQCIIHHCLFFVKIESAARITNNEKRRVKLFLLIHKYRYGSGRLEIKLNIALYSWHIAQFKAYLFLIVCHTLHTEISPFSHTKHTNGDVNFHFDYLCILIASWGCIRSKPLMLRYSCIHFTTSNSVNFMQHMFDINQNKRLFLAKLYTHFLLILIFHNIIQTISLRKFLIDSFYIGKLFCF